MAAKRIVRDLGAMLVAVAGMTWPLTSYADGSRPDGCSERRDSLICRYLAADLGPAPGATAGTAEDGTCRKTRCLRVKEGDRWVRRCLWRCPVPDEPAPMPKALSKRGRDAAKSPPRLTEPAPKESAAIPEREPAPPPPPSNSINQTIVPKPLPAVAEAKPAPPPPPVPQCPAGKYQVSEDGCCSFGTILSGNRCIRPQPEPESMVLITFLWLITIGGAGWAALVLFGKDGIITRLRKPKGGAMAPVTVTVADIELVAQNMPDIKPESVRALILALNGLAAEKRA